MKRLPLLTVLTAVVLAGSVLVEPVHAQTKVERPDATVYVDGLACPFCAYGLEKKLKTLDGLQKMEVQIEEGRVLLVFKEGQTPMKEKIQQAVKKAGFTVRTIEFPEEAPSGSASS